MGEGESSLRRASEVPANRSKFKKVEMPVFSVQDPDSWFFRVERYFELHQVAESKKENVHQWVLKQYRSSGSRGNITDDQLRNGKILRLGCTLNFDQRLPMGSSSVGPEYDDEESSGTRHSLGVCGRLK